MNKTVTHPTVPRPLFTLLAATPADVQVDLDGTRVLARSEDTVAGLLLRLDAPETYRRSAVTGAARAPLCMMGVCFECLVEIDGQKNQQGCMVRVRDGMRIRR
jgi:D-hydroxyproline dehydrogenase subunit gamma